MDCLNKGTIETVGTEEESAEGLEAALGMASEGMEVEEDRGSKGEDYGGGTQRALGALKLLTQETDPSGNTLVDALNEFNELRRLAILWIVR